MASYTLLKNTELMVDLPADYTDQGWVISENIAYHSGCNSGYIERYFDLSSSDQWIFRYTILSVTSGAINIIVDGEVRAAENAPGTYEATFDVTGSNVLVRFFSTGVNSLQLLQVYPATDAAVNETTLAFNEDADRWVTYYSYSPEFMNKFINGFFSFKNGELWEHNVNEVRNNFYGEQFTSKIVFYVNLNPTEVKLFHSMRQKSNKVWGVPEIEIFPYYGKPEGQRSRLKKGRFKNLQGDWFGDFLRDLNDPRYTTELEALFKGAELIGSVMKITIENDDTSEVRLLSLDIIVSLSQYTY